LPKAKKSPTPETADEESPTPKSKSKNQKKSHSKKESKTKSRKGAEPSATPKAKKAATPESEEDEKSPSPSVKSDHAKTQKGKKSAKTEAEETPEPAKTPRPVKSAVLAEPAPSEDSAPPPPALPPPRVVPAPAAAASPGPEEITIEKSGFEQQQGYEPPPPPPPRRGFWSSLFRRSESSASYRYLKRSTIDAIRRAPVQRGRWKFIIVHNSGTRQGNARAFDYYHRHVRRMVNGLAYHFVIGNGTSSGDGQIEIGDRWRRQINGGHVHSDYLNNIGLGICLVGDFNRDQPTRAQLDACEELIRYLRTRCGKIDAHYAIVRPHREVNPPRWATDCPGDAFPYEWFRRFRD